jgi:pimeloyl-ACP methyl ester carboxylesterase
VLVGLKFYTDWLVRRAEANYPPADFVAVEGVQLHYVDAGAGRPVVFIHGGGETLQDFTLSPLYNLVTKDYRAVFVDRPGLGYSQRPTDKAVTLPEQTDLIHRALQQLDIEKPMLVGHSWGGTVVLQYALDYPDDLSGVILLGPAPYPMESTPEPFYDRIVRIPILGDVVLHTLYVPIGYHLVAPAQRGDAIAYFAPLDEVPDSYFDMRMALALRPSHIVAAREERVIYPLGRESVSARLGDVTAPTMIISGSLDDHVMEQVPQLDEDIPNSRVVIMDGAGHYIWFAYPERVVDVIQETWDWVDELETSR